MDSVIICRSKRKTVSLEINEEASLVVRLPMRFPKYRINELIKRHKRWISSKQRQVASRPVIKLDNPVEWYRKQARQLITARVKHYADLLGLNVNKIRISNARKRWGSCSAKNNLSFTWRLILAPLEIIDYVVIHELMHIFEKNHSRRFWARVEEFYPDYRKIRKWLKQNSQLLRV